MFLPLASAALASAVYPASLESELGMPCAPTCVVCHDTNAGGAGTATQPFAAALIDLGLTGASNTASLTTALATMETDGVDSDGDGTTDLDELLDGSDPNPDAEPFCDTLVPEYGCFGGSAAGVGLLIGLGMLRRRPKAG